MKKVFFLLFILPQIANAQDIVTIAGNGSRGFNGDSISATVASLSTPVNVAIDKHGNIYIADSNRVRKVNTAGIITTIAGNGIAGFSGDNNDAVLAELSGIAGITVDNMNNLFITEWGNNRIRKVNAAGIITTIAGNGSYGYNGDNISASSAEINFPTGIITDNVGNVIFSDQGNHRVRKINSSGIISTIAGTGVAGYNGDNGMAIGAELRQPEYLCINSVGCIYISDWGNYSVRQINSEGIITTIAGSGTSGYTGDNGPATSATLGHPMGIIVDTFGNIYISDQSNNVIRKVNTLGIISTIAGTDTAGYSGDNGPAIDAKLNGPDGEAIDSWGNVYIADLYNSRIRKINFNTNGIKGIKYPLSIVSLYPNPATGELTIVSTDEIITVAIYNVIGQTVYAAMSCSTSQVQVDISRLQNGVYFIKVNGDQVRQLIKK